MAESIKEQVKERTERIWKYKYLLDQDGMPTQEADEVRKALNDIRYLNGIEDMLE